MYCVVYCHFLHFPMPLPPSHSPDAVRVRLLVIREIWKLIVAIFVCYMVTLMLFPGLVSEVWYNPIGDWTPVLLVAVFNLTDFIAKVKCSIVVVISRKAEGWKCKIIPPVACTYPCPLAPHWSDGVLNPAYYPHPSPPTLCLPLPCQPCPLPWCASCSCGLHFCLGALQWVFWQSPHDQCLAAGGKS